MKKYNCELCGTEVIIRTKIKNRESEHYGKKCCSLCASKETPKETKIYKIPKQTKENKKLKEEKKSLMDPYYEYHINIIKSRGERCCNCGIKLIGIRDEVAHVLPKRKYKSVRNNLDNGFYMCSRFGINCHGKWDANENNPDELIKFRAFPVAVNRFMKIEKFVLERGKERETLEILVKELDRLSKLQGL